MQFTLIHQVGKDDLSLGRLAIAGELVVPIFTLAARVSLTDSYVLERDTTSVFAECMRAAVAISAFFSLDRSRGPKIPTWGASFGVVEHTFGESARQRARCACRSQHSHATLLRPVAARRRPQRFERKRSRSPSPAHRNHGKRVDDQSRPHHSRAGQHKEHGHIHRAGRLRHGILVAVVLAAATDRSAQDRQEFQGFYFDRALSAARIHAYLRGDEELSTVDVVAPAALNAA